jgi:2-C-methyl-D-erythritol 4-phosphate cytidylyltransferase
MQFGSGIPSVSLSDSIRLIDGNYSKAVNRSDYQIIQTPQCFASSNLLLAFKQAYKREFTDDATVLESFGIPVHLTQGNPENIKLTTPADLKIAEVLINGIA